MYRSETKIGSNHPGWFYQALVEDSFPWTEGVAMSFEEFAQKKYTIHDSYWIGSFFNLAYEPTVTLAIAWDTFWLPDELKKSTSTVKDWPYLLIQLSGVEQFNPSQDEDEIDTCRTILGHKVVEIDGKNCWRSMTYTAVKSKSFIEAKKYFWHWEKISQDWKFDVE
jgi:hypothetical protein